MNVPAASICGFPAVKIDREGVLPPAESGEFIARHAKHVKIHEEGIDKLSQEMLQSVTNKLNIPNTGANISYLPKDDPRAIDWIFVADSLNFCFWSSKRAKKWRVDGRTGYYAIEAALARAVTESIDITNPEYYSNITEDQLRHILRSDNKAEIPLFKQRIAVLHEIGTILLQKYNGTFTSCVKNANKSAVKLLQIIVQNFPCFRDESTFKNQLVSFYKRAQVTVAHIWNFYGGRGWGEFSDIEKITMFADYRVPQVLVHFGAMSYSDELMEKLKNDTLLSSGSEQEVEIRGCSVHTVELLRKRIDERMSGLKNAEVPNSSQIDYYLWCYRRKFARQLAHIPFHKTLGIFY